MSVAIDPSRRDTPRRAAPGGSEQISSAPPVLLDTRPYVHPATRGWRVPMIRTAAYLRALDRRFQPGKELEDWLTAEQEIEDLMACGAASY
jgi:hypothetical protein